MATTPVVVDGRVDAEKLRELLAVQAEQEALDFKATIDFSEPGDQVELVKDLLAMMALADGGYIVVGVDNDGKLARNRKPIDRSHFDSAVLLQKVTSYVDGRVAITSQVHELVSPEDRDEDAWWVALIYAGPPPGLFPLVTIKQGEYTQSGGKKNKVVFQAGQVLVRDGTTTARLSEKFWPRLLDRYRESVKEDTRRDVDALVNRIVVMLAGQQDQKGLVREGGSATSQGTSPTLIDLEMKVATFAIAADALIESGSLPGLDRLLLRIGGELRRSAASDIYAPTQDMLNRIFVLATSAVLYGSDDQLDRILVTLVDYYEAIPTLADAVSNETPQEKQRASAWFEVLSRLYLLGSLAVRRRKWSALRSLVLRPYKVNETYSYASWLRHAITSAARADVLSSVGEEGRGAPVISRAVQLATEVEELRPDVAGADNLYLRMIDSLCEFDILWCILAQTVTTRPEATDFYPSSSELDQEHADGAFILVATDSASRQRLFPGTSDQDIGSALLYVHSRAYQQSARHHGWWGRLPNSVQAWAEQVGARSPDLK